MAEQFVLKGVKELRDYSYTSSPTFYVKNDPRGGNTWQIPKWWDKKGNNTEYVSCTVLDAVGTNYLLVIPTSMDTQLMVTYDDDVYNIKFSNFNAVDRIAITGKDTKKIVVEYLLPSISGGAIAKRILQQPVTIGSFTITGPATAETGQSKQYKSNATPDASDAVYAWTVEENGSAVSSTKAEITAGASSTGCTVLFKQAGNYDIKCVITSATASDSPQSDTRSVSCTTAETVGTVTVTGSATAEAEKPKTYNTSVSGNSVSDLEYQWSVVNATAQIANPTNSSTSITFEAQGNATVQCIVSSASAPDSTSDTLVVDVSPAKTITSVTAQADSTTPQATVADNFQCIVDGNIVDSTYQWLVTPSDGTFSITDATAEATNITFNAINTYDVSCKVTSATANNSPVTSPPVSVTVQGLPSMPGVTLGGPNTIDALNVGRNYTSVTSDGSTLSGTTTYQWTAQDENTSETSGIGVNIATPNAASTSVTFTAAAEGRTIALRCKYTNVSYTDSPKTGKRAVTIDTSGG